MGILTKEQVHQSKIFVSFNNDTGMLCTNKGDIPGIDGELLGFNSHPFEFKNKTYEKFDIWLKDTVTKEVFDIQIGLETWVCKSWMNKLLSIPEPYEGILRISPYKKDDMQCNPFYWNGKKLEPKVPEEKISITKEMSDEAKIKRRNALIGKWYEELMKRKPYDPDVATTNDEENGDVEPAADDDEIPF